MQSDSGAFEYAVAPVKCQFRCWHITELFSLNVFMYIQTQSHLCVHTVELIYFHAWSVRQLTVSNMRRLDRLLSFSCKRVLIFDGSAKELWPSIESTNWCYLMSDFLMQTLTYHQVSAHIYTHMFIFIYTYVCIYIHTMYAYMYAYINMYMCICVYAMEMMWKRNGNTAGFVGCVACIQSTCICTGCILLARQPSFIKFTGLFSWDVRNFYCILRLLLL